MASSLLALGVYFLHLVGQFPSAFRPEVALILGSDSPKSLLDTFINSALQIQRMAEDLESQLAQFTGTTKYYQHWLGYLYTDGIHYLVETASCYWLLDLIGSYQKELEVPFQLWELNLNQEEQTGLITMVEDLGKPELVRQRIPFTDFPLHQIKLYFTNNVLLLPSEY